MRQYDKNMVWRSHDGARFHDHRRRPAFRRLAPRLTLEGEVPFLAAGVVGLIWPENTALQTAAQAAITDLAGMRCPPITT